MPSKNVPHDEWIELVGEDLEDDYSVVVDGDEPIYLKPGSKPHQATAGLPIKDGVIFSAEIDRGEAVWARAQNDTDGSARAVPGIRIDGANERAVSVQASVSPDTYPSGASFDKTTYPISLSPSETIHVIELSIVNTEVDVEISTTGGDTVTIPVDTKSSITSYKADSVTIKNPNDATKRTAGGWAGE